jgi:hypothetical protein
MLTPNQPRMSEPPERSVRAERLAVKPLSRSFAWSWGHLASERSIAEGVVARLLWHDEAGNGALVMRFTPGAALTKDMPPASWPSEIYLLEGSVCDEHRTYSQGMFIHVPGDEPRRLSSPVGAELFVFVRGATSMSPRSLVAAGPVTVQDGSAGKSNRPDPGPEPLIQSDSSSPRCSSPTLVPTEAPGRGATRASARAYR